MVEKVEISCDKRKWHPSPFPGQVVLITTIDDDGKANVAPKSWISMVAFGPPPVLMFGCNLDHSTARNILITKQFVVNVPGKDLIETCWAIGADHQSQRWERFERHGLTTIDSRYVKPPSIEECRAHFECELEITHEWKREVAIFGTIKGVVIDKQSLEGSTQEMYEYLAPCFFLEDRIAAVVNEIHGVIA